MRKQVVCLSVCETLLRSIGSTVGSSYQTLPPMPKSNREDGEQQALNDFVSYPKKLQHQLSTKIASDKVVLILLYKHSLIKMQHG